MRGSRTEARRSRRDDPPARPPPSPPARHLGLGIRYDPTGFGPRSMAHGSPTGCAGPAAAAPRAARLVTLLTLACALLPALGAGPAGAAPGDPSRPFPRHQAYTPGSIRPSLVLQAGQDAAVATL